VSTTGATGTMRERRTERRIAVHLPLQVRGKDRDGVAYEVSTETENVCRSGTAFVISREIDLGATVEITITLPPKYRQEASDFATVGRIVHVKPGKSKHEKVVGVEFTGPRFHRIFAPETPS